MAVCDNVKKIKKELDIKTPREGDVIREYFRNKDIMMLKNSYIDMDRITALRKKIGGQIILCHPAKHAHISLDFFQDLKNIGLDGVEKLSPHHSYNAMMYVQCLARELGLIETGGSDFHRFEGNNFPLQYAWQYFKVESEYLRKIERIIR